MRENPLDQPLICPFCESKYREVHGWVFPVGDPQGHRCDHSWHLGKGYDPSVLTLTDADRAFLADLLVGV